LATLALAPSSRPQPQPQAQTFFLAGVETESSDGVCGVVWSSVVWYDVVWCGMVWFAAWCVVCCGTPCGECCQVRGSPGSLHAVSFCWPVWASVCFGCGKISGFVCHGHYHYHNHYHYHSITISITSTITTTTTTSPSITSVSHSLGSVSVSGMCLCLGTN
jgi:hypothetical protein